MNTVTHSFVRDPLFNYDMSINVDLFRKWVDRQQRDKTYSFQSPYNCALAQYLRDAGYTDFRVGGTLWFLDGPTGTMRFPIGDELAKTLATLYNQNRWTFGDLADALHAKFHEGQ